MASPWHPQSCAILARCSVMKTGIFMSSCTVVPRDVVLSTLTSLLKPSLTRAYFSILPTTELWQNCLTARLKVAQVVRSRLLCDFATPPGVHRISSAISCNWKTVSGNGTPPAVWPPTRQGNEHDEEIA